MAPTSLVADSGEGKMNTSAMSAAGSASAAGDSAWSADVAAKLSSVAPTANIDPSDRAAIGNFELVGVRTVAEALEELLT